MDCHNIPVQVIAHYDASGTMRPLRFQFEDARRNKQTVCVEQVTDVRRLELGGEESMMFLCKGDSHMYELKYTPQDQKWLLFRQIY